MSSATIATVIGMMESVPESIQNRIVEHLRNYFDELKDEIEWDLLVSKTQPELIETAKRAKNEIVAGHAVAMDCGQL